VPGLSPAILRAYERAADTKRPPESRPAATGALFRRARRRCRAIPAIGRENWVSWGLPILAQSGRSKWLAKCLLLEKKRINNTVRA